MSATDKLIELIENEKREAYRRGWTDAMTALRKVSLDLRYRVPQVGEIDFGKVVEMNNLAIGLAPFITVDPPIGG